MSLRGARRGAVEAGPLALLGAGMTAHLGFLLWFSMTNTIDYSDSFEILRNAQTLAHVGSGGWYISRPVAMPMILAPFVRLGPDAGFLSAHLIAFAFSIASLAMTFLLSRRCAGPVPAIIATALLAWNDLWVQNVAMIKEDIPSTVFLTAAAVLLSGADAPASRRARAGAVCLGFALATRFNLIPVGYFLLAAFILMNRSHVRLELRSALPLLVLGIIPAGVFLGLLVVAYPAAGLSRAGEAPAAFVGHFRVLLGRNQATDQTVWIYYLSLGTACTLPVIALAFFGALRGLSRGNRPVAMMTSLFLFYFLLHGFGIGTKEARFMLPILPLLYAMAAVGIEALAPALPARRSTVILLGAALFLLPSIRMVDTWGRLRDPIYRADIPRRMSRLASSHAGENPVTWVGTYYPISPRDRVVFPGDPYTCIYHLREHVLSFFMERSVGRRETHGFVVPPSHAGEDVSYPVLHGPAVIHGEVWIVNREPRSYESWSIPDPLLPLRAQRAIVTVGEAIAGDSTSRIFRVGGGRVTVFHGEDAAVTGVDVPPGVYQLQYLVGGNSSLSNEVVESQNGSFLLKIRKGLGDPFPDRVDLVSYQALPPL